MDLFQLLSSQDVNWWTGVVWITCGLLWCFYQLFGLSFWRHPFTEEHPLLRQWCNATFLQIWWRNKLIYILDGLRVSTFSAHFHIWLSYSFNNLKYFSTDLHYDQKDQTNRRSSSFPPQLLRGLMCCVSRVGCTWESTRLVGGNSSQVAQVALIPHQHDDDVVVGVISQLFQPALHVLIGQMFGDVVHQQRADRAAIIPAHVRKPQPEPKYQASLLLRVLLLIQFQLLFHWVNTLYFTFSRRFYPKWLTVHSGYTFFISMCSLGIEPTTFCAANTMLYHWATGTF